MPATLSLQRSRAVRISTGIFLPALAPFFQDADAVHLRQADIEHHGVVGFGFAEIMALLAVERLVDDVAGFGQGVSQLAIQVRSSSTTRMRIYFHPKVLNVAGGSINHRTVEPAHHNSHYITIICHGHIIELTFLL